MGLTPVDVTKIARILLRDRRDVRTRQRVPEPMVLDTAAEVEEFEAGSATSHGLSAMYEVSARSISRLLPLGGRVVDLGCGSGRFARRLAEQRPDCRILGLDLSAPMLELARQHAVDGGVDGRVRFARADVTEIGDDVLGERVDLVACLNLLHQLPDEDALDRCVQEIARVHRSRQAAVFVLDLQPYNRPDTFGRLLEIAEPELPPDSRRQARESEAAAFPRSLVAGRLRAAGIGGLRSAGDSMLRTTQIHWARSPRDPASARGAFQARRLSGEARMIASAYRGLP